jgi:hypothetical protein
VASTTLIHLLSKCKGFKAWHNQGLVKAHQNLQPINARNGAYDLVVKNLKRLLLLASHEKETRQNYEQTPTAGKHLTLFFDALNTVVCLEARRLDAKHVSDDKHEEILDKIARRAALAHEEILENECDSNSDSHISSSDDSDTDNNKSGADNK